MRPRRRSAGSPSLRAGRPPRSHQLTAALSTTFVSLVAAGTAFVVNVLMSRTLGPASRGEVALVLQLGYVVAPLLSLGLDRQALRQLPGGAAPRMSVVWLVAVPLAAALALGGATTAAAGVCVAAWTAHLSVERGVGMAGHHLRRYLGLSLLAQGWILSSSTVLFARDVTDLDLWVAVYLVPAPLLLLSACVPRRGDPGRRFGPSRASLTYMVGGVLALLAGRVERLLLPVLSSSRELGLYMSVATVTEMVAWAARGLGDSRVQTFAADGTSRRAVARAAARDALLFAAASVPVAALTAFVVVPLLGSGFSDARGLVLPLSAASVAWCVYLQLSSAWLGSGTPRQSLGLEATTAALTAVAALVLVPPYGAAGAALGCLLAYVVMSVVAVVLLPRRPAPADRSPE